MKNPKITSVVFWPLFFVFCLFASCGGGGGSGVSNDTEVEYGSELNSDWDVVDLDCEGTVTDGTFTADDALAELTIADGVMSPCVNSTSDPTIETTSSKPSGFDINTDSSEENVTWDGLYYTFNLNGDMGFITTEDGAVSITLPYDIDLVSENTPINVFVRILNLEDNSLHDIWGNLSGGYITIETLGLPNEFTAAVIFNPYMDAVSSDAVQTMISPLKGVTSSTWGADKWCVIYDPFSDSLEDALQVLLGHTPGFDETRAAVKTYVADVTATVQAEFESKGFRAPNLHVDASWLDPCSNEYGANDRYTIHLSDNVSSYAPTVRGSYYGRVYIQYADLDDAKFPGSAYGSAKATIAHELLHAVQDGYMLSGETLDGYGEGTATTYSVTIDNDDVVSVRSGEAGETKLLSDFLTINKKGDDKAPSYANQDFFAYVANKYDSLTYGYLPGLFESLYDYIDESASDAANNSQALNIRYKPPRNILFNGMDAYFQDRFSKSLREIYLDFLRQRAFDHNEESQFGRTGETTSGFASNLFESGSIATVSINAATCDVTNSLGKFSNVAPYAARAIKITTSTATSAETGPKVSVILTPSSGSVGTEWGAISYRGGVSTEISTDSLEYTDFGGSSSDEVIIAIANTTNNSVGNMEFQVSCEDAEGGTDDGGNDNDDGEDTVSGTSTFTLTSFTQEGASITPAWISAGSTLSIGYSSMSIFVAESEVNDESGWQYQDYLLLQLSTMNVTGPGTYTVSGCYVESGAATLVYDSSNDDNNSCATGGTITFTEYGTSAGDHMTGSMNVTMGNLLSPEVTGTITATFDLVMGSSNAL